MSDPIFKPMEVPRMTTREFFAIKFAVALVQINRKDQITCNMGAACDMADALIKNLNAPAVKEPEPAPPSIGG